MQYFLVVYREISPRYPTRKHCTTSMYKGKLERSHPAVLIQGSYGLLMGHQRVDLLLIVSHEILLAVITFSSFPRVNELPR